MSPFFVLPIIAYVIVLLIIGIAYLSHLIETSDDERNEDKKPWQIWLVFWLAIFFWPVLGLPFALNANDDKRLDFYEAVFIILELMFWIPIISFFVNMWLF